MSVERAIFKPDVIKEWAIRRQANARAWRWKWAFYALIWVGSAVLWFIDFLPWYVLLIAAVYISLMVQGAQRIALKCPHCEKHVMEGPRGGAGVTIPPEEDYWCPHCLHWLVAPHLSPPKSPDQ